MSTFAIATSPGIDINEIDLTQIVSAVSASTAAGAGIFSWGPIHTPVLLASETDLFTRFGPPSNLNPETWFSASSFLSYAAGLYMTRGANTTSTNAQIGVYNAIGNTSTVANIVAQVTRNPTDYQNKLGTYDTNVLYLAKYPGTGGNSLRLAICDSVNAYSSNVSMSTSSATAALAITAGANTGKITVSPTGSGAQADAYNLALTISNALTEGDLITVGNTTIGQQYVQISALGVATNAASNTATISLQFTDPYKRPVNWSSNTITRFWEFYALFQGAPSTSAYVLQNGNTAAIDTLHAVVVDTNGFFSGEPGKVLESYKSLSRATDALNVDGTTNYYATVLNRSQYIWWANDRAGAVSNTSSLVTSSTNSGALDLIFAGGTDGLNEGLCAPSDITTAFDLYQDADAIDISLVITGKSIGGVSGELLGNYIIDNITSTRKDCVAFVSPNIGAVVNNVGNERDALVAFRALTRNTSYGFLDSGYKMMYDRYNNLYRWVPLNGDMAGLAARCDQTKAPWWAFAGFNRGILKNVTKLAYSPNKTDRNVLFPNNINPVINDKNYGPVLYGDKTMQTASSAFDAINVRRLFIVLEKAIALASKVYQWEFNDAYTQAQFRNMVNPYLRNIQGQRGIIAYLVQCDGTNNDAQVINQDGFVGSIYIQPNRAIRNIQLNFVATPAGVTFTEAEATVNALS